MVDFLMFQDILSKIDSKVYFQEHGYVEIFNSTFTESCILRDFAWLEEKILFRIDMVAANSQHFKVLHQKRSPKEISLREKLYGNMKSSITDILPGFFLFPHQHKCFFRK